MRAGNSCKKSLSLREFSLSVLGIFLLFGGLVQADGVVEEWVARYNGPGNYVDYASAMALDSSGNVYVTGSSYASGTYDDFTTIKYDSEGNQIWLARYNGPKNSGDGASSIALDSSGNVYVTGGSYGSDTGSDFATIKYDSDGNQQWVARYNGPGNDYDRAYAIALDGSGNVYVTGISDGGSVSYYDYATIKYDSDGNQLWAARYNGPVNLYDEARAIALDGAGNVYVTGYCSGGIYEPGRDYATIKYDSDGNQVWVARYNGPGDSADEAHAMALDGSGNVYVTGYSYGGSVPYYDYATIKYDSDGNQLWVARYNAPGNYDKAYAIAVDGSGNVYVTGISYGSYGSGTHPADYATIKYDSDGNQQWVARYNSPGNHLDAARAIDVDSSGNVYVTGLSFLSGTHPDYTTIKYDSDGNKVWLATYNGPGNDYDYVSAIALDSSGNVYVTGRSNGGWVDDDYATIKYSQVCIADLNNDGTVDFADYAIFALHWPDVGCTDPNWCGKADLNKTGEVDWVDLKIFTDHWLE